MTDLIGVERRRGKWIKHANCRGGVFYQCSSCNIVRRNAATLLFNYCPNCGAKMDKEWLEEK